MSEIDDLKTRVSRRWLGRGGVSAVGVEQRDGEAVVVVTLEGEGADTAASLREEYADSPVHVETGGGRIRPLS
jgi:hypothetical protein